MIKTSHENDENFKKKFCYILLSNESFVKGGKKNVVILNHITITDKMIKRHNGLFDNVTNKMTNLGSMSLHTTND